LSEEILKLSTIQLDALKEIGNVGAGLILIHLILRQCKIKR